MNSESARAVEQRSRSNESHHADAPSKPLYMRTLVLCCLAVILDGFDTAAISFASPAIAAEWSLPSAALTPAFVATSLGAVIGFIVGSILAARWNHRIVILASIAWFGTASLLSAVAGSILELATLRLATGLALGAALPSAIALASEYSTARLREVTATIVSAGFGLGVVIGGLLAKPLLNSHSWTSLFIVGGLVPLGLLAVFWLGLPRSRPVVVRSQVSPDAPSRASTPHTPLLLRFAANLLVPPLRRSTVLLWVFAFLIFMDTYLFTYWTPILLTHRGFSTAEAAIGPAAFGTGALLGAVLATPAIARFGIARVLVFTCLTGVLCVGALGLLELEKPWTLAMLAGAGAGMGFGNIGVTAIAVSLYGQSLRVSGIGCAAAIGRLGAIAGPALGGALLYLNWTAEAVLLSACVPAAAAAAVMLQLSRSSALRAAPSS